MEVIGGVPGKLIDLLGGHIRNNVALWKFIKACSGLGSPAAEDLDTIFRQLEDVVSHLSLWDRYLSTVYAALQGSNALE